MFFRIAAHPEAEVRVPALEQGHNVAAVAQAVLEGGGGGKIAGNVAAQGHDVADSPGVVGIGDGGDFRARVVHGGEVRHDRETQLIPEQGGHMGGALARAAAGTVGDGDEVGPDPLQRRGGAPQGIHAGVVLGRKKLEGTQRPPLREEFRDGPVGGHIRPPLGRDWCRGKARSLSALSDFGHERHG